MHSLMISSEVCPRSRSVFSCIFATTSSWLSEPPLTPMRTGLSWSRATLQMVANCSSRRLPVPTLPGLMRYLSSASAQSGISRQQQVAVVVEIADERRGDARVEHPLLDLGHGGRRLGHVDRDAHHLGPGFGQLDALPRGRRRVRRVGHRHRLDDDGRAAADLDTADAYADCLVKPDGRHVAFFGRSYHPGSAARGRATPTGHR